LAVQEKDDDAEDDGSVLSSLLDEMRPYVLRRVKAHVEKSVPPKEEIVVSVALAPLQKRYYRALYEKNVLMLAGAGRPVDGPSLMNLAMELRKCCNHPFLLKGVERQEEARLSGQTERERLVGACGKLQFLDKLLPRLFQESNRKVLIFSQFVMMLDVLSDYLRSAKYAHGRVDGGVTGRDRQKQIDQFAQQGEGAVRVMLLSTRAGGVGINLVAADTVVVYDSDWNPQNDVQAMARCHRIGQTRKVTVYRLLTAGTYEAHMYAVATAKLSLDRAVLDGMASANAGNRHLHESLLKQGAGAVSFKPHAVNKELDGDDDEDAKAFRDQSLDDILATRSKAVVLASDTSGGALESLSSATFVASKVSQSESTLICMHVCIYMYTYIYMYFNVVAATPSTRRPAAATPSPRVATPFPRRRRTRLRWTTPTSGRRLWARTRLSRRRRLWTRRSARPNKVIKNMFIITVPWIASRRDNATRTTTRTCPKIKKNNIRTTGARPKRGSCG
jgi:hypothetical protein